MLGKRPKWTKRSPVPHGQYDVSERSRHHSTPKAALRLLAGDVGSSQGAGANPVSASALGGKRERPSRLLIEPGLGLCQPRAAHPRFARGVACEAPSNAQLTRRGPGFERPSGLLEYGTTPQSGRAV